MVLCQTIFCGWKQLPGNQQSLVNSFCFLVFEETEQDKNVLIGEL